MKKTAGLLTIAIALISLSGCGEAEVPTIVFKGAPTKTSYNFTDSSWDLSGIQIYGKFSDGNERKLNEDEYTMTLVPETPRGNKGNGFMMYVLPKNGEHKKSKRFHVNVSLETYSFENEVDEYYKDFTINQSNKTTNLVNLQKLSFNTHKTWVTYGSVSSYYDVTDGHRSCDEVQGDYKNEGFYTSSRLSFKTGSREHVWACADSSGAWTHGGTKQQNVDNDNYIGGGSDLYHVRPCNSQLNTVRGDASFTELYNNYKLEGDDGSYQLKCFGSSYSDNSFSKLVEPADEFKGDIARILAYVYMHYGIHSNSSKNFNYTYNLELEKVLTKTNRYSSIYEMLKAWNEIDSVSEVEKYRNHTVMGIQGNRNPFVDHPEWIDLCF